MNEIDKSCDIFMIIFFDFWRSSSNAKLITQFCKKHFIQLIKLTSIFNLINNLTNCFNATCSKASLTFKSKQISVFSWFFIICTSCIRFSIASYSWSLFSIFYLIKVKQLVIDFSCVKQSYDYYFSAIFSKQFNNVIILYIFEIE